MKITQEGKKKAEEKLQELKAQLAALEKEKALAYDMTGDTWHDNPYFIMLVRNETSLTEKIKETEELLQKAEVLESSDRGQSVVDIGAIIECIRRTPGEERCVFEIVGHGETNLRENKIAYDSPIGQNLMGHTAGDVVSFQVPAGVTSYEIIRFYPSWDAIK